MGIQINNFSGREMGCIVGQKSQVMVHSVCLSEIFSFSEPLQGREEKIKPADLYRFPIIPTQQAGDYLYDLHLTPGL